MEESMMTNDTGRPAKGRGASRRKFLKGASIAAAGAAGALAMPQVSLAQTTTWRFQSTWPAQDIFHEFAADYVRAVNSMSGGRLVLELLPAGAVVGSLQVQDAVIAGALDGGHGVTAYWYGKNKAYSLFGTPPAYGWDANQFMSWMRYGGGYELYDELVTQVLGLDLVGFFTGPFLSQPLGWFKQEVTGPEQLRGMKFRTVGLAADLFNEMGVAVTILGSPDIVPSLDRGVIDGAEFNNPSSDRTLGFADVSKNLMVRSYHQDCECFEVIFNRTKYNALPEELRAIIRYAADAASADMYWKALKRYPEDAQALREAGVSIKPTPDSVLEAQLAAWDKVIENASKDPFFAKVIESQRAFASQKVGWFLEYTTPKQAAFDHFFGKA
jgi:TRAP-type mannitol/chloroaromatic compound transport system substrate-binding protein